MTRHPGEMSWSFGPGPAAMDARRTRETRQTYAAMTAALWEAAWDPPHPDGRGPLAYVLDQIN